VPTLEFHVFLPQMRLTMPQLVERARAAESAGFGGVAGMDHLAPPLAEQQPMFEAMVTNTWLAAHTDRLRISSLVLCDAFRHPAMLAREAVSIDHASNGRFELGLGWGSVAAELGTYGVGATDAPTRVGRMQESLEIIRALWSGERIDYEGEHFTLHDAQQMPRPLSSIPIVIGGAGPKTLELVAQHADWWNIHIGVLRDKADRLDDLRSRIGDARPSVQVQVAYVHDPAMREEVAELARRRFGPLPVVGTGPELVEHFGGLADQGFERIYAWFCDFAPPETLHAFGETVVGAFAS
jgi:alkanesulfonate monooxygenase SsuD/methylene tetrahydromethanopterin reductase-like flavin-dependent oxidoreductase (luciferase family)